MLQSNHLIGFGIGAQVAGSTTVTINTSDGTAGAQNFTFISRGTAVVNGVTISSIGFYSLTARTVKVKVCLRNSANNYDIVSDTSYSHGGTGWEDVSITPYAVPGSGTYYIGGYCSAGGANPNVKTSAARTYKSGDVTGTGQTTTGEDTSTAFPLRYTYS